MQITLKQAPGSTYMKMGKLKKPGYLKMGNMMGFGSGFMKMEM